MKRFFYLAFAALAVFACTPEEQPEKQGGNEGDNGGEQVETGGYDSISITLKGANLKTAWAEGDALQVYAVTAEGADIEAKYVLSAGAGTATGTFAPAAGETALPKGGKDYFAAYPYDEDRTFAQHNTFTVVVPAEQTGANPIFAHATDAASMEISSFMGAIKFTLSGKAELKGIALEDANSNSILSGNVTFNAKTGKASFKNSSATKHEINYMLPDKLVLNGTSDPFIIEVPAGTLADGGKLTLFDMNDNAAAVIEFPAKTIEAAAIADLGNLSFEAVSQTVDLSIAGTANCYIIPSTGVYKFKAVKGNSNEEVAAASVEVFWETREDTLAIEPGTIIKSV
ncbi:MAG: fimbrillin family protein, partial [Bacteroidales bacterium]|nr:fimbrillin family protein [Bacteroidales bacterium]